FLKTINGLCAISSMPGWIPFADPPKKTLNRQYPILLTGSKPVGKSCKTIAVLPVWPQSALVVLLKKLRKLGKLLKTNGNAKPTAWPSWNDSRLPKHGAVSNSARLKRYYTQLTSYSPMTYQHHKTVRCFWSTTNTSP